jgi:peptidyl-Lys metalloendopeptidase
MRASNKGLSGILALVLLCFGVSANAANISVDIDIENYWMDASQDVLVHITLTNNDKKPAKLLKWYTAADGIEENLFKISRDGENLRYLGALFKRPAPQAGNYLHLKAGESITQTAEISSVYDFSKTGDYRVQFAVESMQLFDPAASHRQNQTKSGVAKLVSNELMFWVEGRDWASPGLSDAKGSAKGGNGKGKPPSEPPPSGERISFTGRCSNGQQSEILTAIDEAIGISADARSYMNGSLGDRYTTWFGTVNSTRSNQVKNNFNAITDAMANEDITVDCKCKQNYYAYVYPTQPYKIYVCSAFWAAPMTGTDSKAGTLVHEMSHFDVVAGTDDVVYGQAGAKSLANTSPNDAIRNADSHEYFAENTPELD